jgi:hypothetical protein
MTPENTQPPSVEEILASLDSMDRAGAPAFFYTRLQAKLDNRVSSADSWIWIHKPVLSFATLGLLLVLNVFAISKFLQKDQSSATSGSGIETFAKEYGLDGSSVYTEKTAR